MIRKSLTILSLLGLLLGALAWILCGVWSLVYVPNSMSFHIVAEGGAIALFIPEESYIDASVRAYFPRGQVMHILHSEDTPPDSKMCIT